MTLTCDGSGVDEVGHELRTFRHRSRDDGGRRGSEHKLEEEM